MEEIELEITDSLRAKGLRLKKHDKTIVLENADGNRARSYIYQEYNKTADKLVDEIEKTQLISDAMTQQEILSCLSKPKNYDKLYNGHDDSAESSKPITQQQIELTEDITKEVDFAKVEQILSTSIKKDEAPKVITFCGMLLAQTDNDQINIGFQAESSAGKSYIPIEVSLYFPKDEVDEIAGSSPTAFFHDSGQWDKENKALIVNLRHKNLIFLDMPHFQLLEKLRPMLSHDRQELQYRITDKNQKHGLRTKHVTIKGFPSVFFCSTNANPDDQEKTRMLLLSPSTDQQKLVEAIKLSALRKSNPDEYNRRILQDPDRAWLTSRILGVRQWGIREVEIPDEGSAVCRRFLREHPYLTARHQRDFPRILAFVKSHALLNCFNRQRKEGKPTTIIATQADIDGGYALYQKIEKSNELGLSPYIYDIYETVVQPLLNPLIGASRETMLKKYYETKHKMLSPETLKREIIPQLELVGLVMQNPDPSDKRKMLVYPTVSPPNSFSQTSNQASLNALDKSSVKSDDNGNGSHMPASESIRGEHSGVNLEKIFWQTYDALEDKTTHRVTESSFKAKLIAIGSFTASEAQQAIKEAKGKGELTNPEYDILQKAVNG